MTALVGTSLRMQKEQNTQQECEENEKIDKNDTTGAGNTQSE